MPTYTRRKDPDLVGRFAKDPAQEDFLERLNAILAPHDAAEERELEEAVPTLQVIGVPRSGTTLLYQLVASELQVGYVDNLVAAFWRAPSYGVQLSRKLGLGALDSSFESSFGRTRGVQEPHEFGYFWNHRLGYPDLAEREPAHEDAIDWAGLRRTILNMAHHAGAPMAFKPMLLVWHLEALLRAMPRTCFVWIRRPRRDTALSLLKMRMSLFGSYEPWASLRPLAAPADGPPWQQVAAQVVLLERAIAAAAVRMGPEHVVAIDYAELCADPDAAVERVRDLMAAKGHRPERRGRELAPFTPATNVALEGEFGARVDAALAEYAAAGPEAAG